MKRERMNETEGAAPPKNRRRGAAILIICIAAAVLVIWTVWGNTALMLEEITVSGENLPEGFDGFRIAHVSDLHNAEFGEGNEKLLSMLSECAPDMIAVTGDLVDSNHTDIGAALQFIKGAVTIAPVYYVTGNHEERIINYAELEAALIELGVTVLNNATAELERDGDKLLLIGLEDSAARRSGGGLNPSQLLRRELIELVGDGEEYMILLSHRPEAFREYVLCGVDLAMCGHAHGGQFRLPFIGGLFAPGQGFFPEYDAGVYEDGGTSMVVSRGLGNSVIPVRFNNRPEVVLITLSKTAE